MHGNELLETLRSFAPGGPVAAVLRHAARYPIVDLARPELAEITPEGGRAAEEMGRRLHGFDRVRLFHSPVKRCQQTAECLARGAQAAGLKVDHLGADEALGVDYILNLAEAGRLSQVHGEHFVRLWIQGDVPPGIIRNTRHIAELKMASISQRLAEPGKGGRRLDLHVSHDWNIMVLREYLLGVRHEEAGWLKFLDGLGLCLCAGVLRVEYREHVRSQPLPWRF